MSNLAQPREVTIPEETEAEKDKSVAPPPDEVQWAAEEQAPAGSELAAAAPASARSRNCQTALKGWRVRRYYFLPGFRPSCLHVYSACPGPEILLTRFRTLRSDGYPGISTLVSA